jgi:hypothetical protein
VRVFVRRPLPAMAQLPSPTVSGGGLFRHNRAANPFEAKDRNACKGEAQRKRNKLPDHGYKSARGRPGSSLGATCFRVAFGDESAEIVMPPAPARASVNAAR